METDHIYAVLAGLLVLFFLKKNKTVEAQGENLEVKEKLNEIQKEIIKTDAKIEIEAEKRDSVKKEMEEKINDVLSEKEIADFFNRNK